MGRLNEFEYVLELGKNRVSVQTVYFMSVHSDTGQQVIIAHVNNCLDTNTPS